MASGLRQDELRASVPSARPIAVCFVCLGNICRSPQAEALFRSMVRESGLDGAFHIDSAGTCDNHVGQAPDSRTAAASARRGVRVAGAARQFVVADFDRFDVIVVMDTSNLDHVRRLARNDGDRAKVSLMRSWDPAADSLDVPDPWYGGPNGFDDVFDICRSACAGLLARLRADHEVQR